MSTVLEVLKVKNIDSLYHHSPRQDGPQPCELWLDTRNGQLSCGFNPELGNMIPLAQQHRLLLVAQIPCLTADAANTLLDSVRDLAKDVLDGADIRWNGYNHVGVYTPEAETAWNEIVQACSADNFKNSDLVVGWYAEDWFTEGIEDLGITADTSDGELWSIAREQVANAAAATEYGHGVLDIDAAYAFLAAAHAELRAVELGKIEDQAYDITTALEALADQAKPHRATRDEILLRLSAWKKADDEPAVTTRELGDMFGISHAQVQRIVRSARAAATAGGDNAPKEGAVTKQTAEPLHNNSLNGGERA